MFNAPDDARDYVNVTFDISSAETGAGAGNAYCLKGVNAFLDSTPVPIGPDGKTPDVASFPSSAVMQVSNCVQKSTLTIDLSKQCTKKPFDIMYLLVAHGSVAQVHGGVVSSTFDIYSDGPTFTGTDATYTDLMISCKCPGSYSTYLSSDILSDNDAYVCNSQSTNHIFSFSF
jgi:hypothetical protein